MYEYLLTYIQCILKNKLNAEQRHLKSWLIQNAPVRSGTRGERRVLWGTQVQTHQNYLKCTHKKRSLNWLRKWMKVWKIKVSKYDRYRCELCFKGRALLKKKNLNKAQKQLVQRYKIHNQLVKQQRACYVKMMKELKKGKALVIFDYSTFNEVTKFKVKILNFTVVFLGPDNEKKYRYFDYLAEAKADYRFTIASWHHLLRNLKKSITGLKTIEAWADGGLKTKERQLVT